MDYRTSARVVAALAAGEERCLAAAAAAPDFDPAVFADFVEANNLVPWVAPLCEGEAGRALFPAAWAAEVSAARPERAERQRVMLALYLELGKAFEEASVPSLLLKGFTYGQRLYGDVGRRHQWDVDLLVRRPDLERALEVFARLGFDATTNVDDDKPVAKRLREIRGTSPERAPHGVTVRRDGVKADLHWCLISRSVHRIDEDGVWARRQEFRLGGQRFETLSDEDGLAFLLASLCIDLRRGACRAKHFLDLQLLIRSLGRDFDWDGFLERRRAEALLRPLVNVLAVFLVAWDCAAELPDLARAVDARRGLLELRDAEEALAVATRPRGNHANRFWFRRVYPRSPWVEGLWRLTRDLPYTLRRMGGARFEGRLSPEPEVVG